MGVVHRIGLTGRHNIYNIVSELEPLFFRLQVLIGGKSALHWSHLALGEKPLLAVTAINGFDGIRHRALVLRGFSRDDADAIIAGAAEIEKALNGVKMGFSGHLSQNSVPEWSDDLPYSNRLFIFTDQMQSPRAELLGLLNSANRRAVIVDDEDWQRRLSLRRPDAFIAHDSRDKDGLARPLAHALSRMGLIVWYDEFSLKPGDRLSQSIDKGLTECRHAVLIVTERLLENSAWASTEMSALLSRAVHEPNTIIPVWSGVGRDAVASRSARLADIVAITASLDIDELATRIYAAIGGPEGSLAAGTQQTP